MCRHTSQSNEPEGLEPKPRCGQGPWKPWKRTCYKGERNLAPRPQPRHVCPREVGISCHKNLPTPRTLGPSRGTLYKGAERTLSLNSMPVAKTSCCGKPQQHIIEGESFPSPLTKVAWTARVLYSFRRAVGHMTLSRTKSSLVSENQASAQPWWQLCHQDSGWRGRGNWLAVCSSKQQGHWLVYTHLHLLKNPGKSWRGNLCKVYFYIQLCWDLWILKVMLYCGSVKEIDGAVLI